MNDPRDDLMTSAQVEVKEWKVWAASPPSSGKNGKNFVLVARPSPIGSAKEKRRSARTPHKAEAVLAAVEWARKLNLDQRNRRGCVYFIRNVRTRAVKIGWSADPERRRRDLQTVCEDELVLAVVLRGAPRSAEFALHSRLQAARLHGEWFRGDEIERIVLAFSAGSPTWHAVLKLLPTGIL